MQQEKEYELRGLYLCVCVNKAKSMVTLLACFDCLI